jgi:hypothetical protein
MRKASRRRAPPGRRAPPAETEAPSHRPAAPWRAATVALLIALLVQLGARANSEYRWSAWAFGDAQTMLSNRQWTEGGWLHNRLLFNPQGYAAAIEVVDEPALRHHAHGTYTRGAHGIGPRRLYTHYPPGYLLPFATLHELGFERMAAARLLAVAMSVAALGVFFLAFSLAASPAAAFGAVALIALSSPFQRYADSLANHAVDDLLRALFVYAVILSTRAVDDVLRRRAAVAAWGVALAMALSSVDSTFFLWAFVVAWHAFEAPAPRLRHTARVGVVYGLAPVLGHALLLLQNAWYLGLPGALQDLADIAGLKSGAQSPSGAGRWSTWLDSIALSLDDLYGAWPVALLAAGRVALHLRARLGDARGDEPSGRAELGLLAALLAGGVAFRFVLVHHAMTYEARHYLPFAMLLASTTAVALAARDRRGPSHAPGIYTAAALCLLAWVGSRTYSPGAFSTAEPARERAAVRLIVDRVRPMTTRYERVIFARAALPYHNASYHDGVPQVDPTLEYYARAPILCFERNERLATDLRTMVARAPARFSPVLLFDTRADLDETVRALGDLLARPPPEPAVLNRRLAVDLTDVIDPRRWRAPAPTRVAR